MKSGLSMTLDRVADVVAGIRSLGEKQVLVGVPEAKDERKDGDEITNAALAYIHTNGAPEVGIPARPFIQPGIKEKQDEISSRLKETAVAVLDGNTGTAERGLAAAGQIGASAAQNKIREGLQPPLKESTIAARRIRSKGSRYRRKATAASAVKPLLDTAQLLRAITWVIRKR